jgi:hypothetical protein
MDIKENNLYYDISMHKVKLYGNSLFLQMRLKIIILKIV